LILEPIKLAKGCWLFPRIDNYHGKFKISFAKNIHDNNCIYYDTIIEALEEKEFNTKQCALKELEKLMSIVKENYRISGDSIFWAMVVLMLAVSFMTYKMGIYTEKISWYEEQVIRIMEVNNESQR
jgi:hypothetical protein